MTSPAASPGPSPDPAASPAPPARRRALAVLGVLVLVAGAAWFGYDRLVGSRHESTDNAYAQGPMVQVTPQVGGTVTAILVDEGDPVKAGQTLVRLDPADARLALQQAEAALGLAVRQTRALYAQPAGAAALTEGVKVENHPAVLAAAARLREAWLASQRLALPAPVDGHVARRLVQLGQRVAPGAPLLTVVPLDQLWVDANFKEVQLGRLRVGQPARVTADVYGRSVVFRGTVAGLGVGTGAAFALLPPQNATGNWIKVVQRVPVRIALDPAELARHPLRVGLSMNVEVDVSRQDGPVLAERPAGPGAQTDALSPDLAAADARVRQVIEAHLGGAPAAPRAASVASTSSR